MKTICPICKGKGKIITPRKQSNHQMKVKAVLILRKENYSIREIMSLLGYKSPRSIQCILENCDKGKTRAIKLVLTDLEKDMIKEAQQEISEEHRRCMRNKGKYE